MVIVLVTAVLQIIGINLVASILLSTIAVSVFLSRVSLVFPAIAIDNKMTFLESFEYTKDFKLLIFTTIIVFPVLFTLIVGGVYTLVINLLASNISPHLNILLVLSNVAISVFLVSALSNTYIYISETLSKEYGNDDSYIEDDDSYIEDEDTYNEDDNIDSNKDKE